MFCDFIYITYKEGIKIMFYEAFSGAFSEGGSSQVLFGLALALFMGLLLSRVVKPLKLPAVTGYLIAGVLIGPYCLGALGITGVFSNEETLKGTGAIVQDVALGFIAFMFMIKKITIRVDENTVKTM